MRRPTLLVMALVVMAALAAVEARPTPVRIGSKKFTESAILGEIGRALIRAAGLPAAHRPRIGGTREVWAELEAGRIDAYVDYTGTLRETVFAGRPLGSVEALGEALRQRGLGATEPLGFNDTYAIGMREADAERLGIKKISDLRGKPALRLCFSPEFLVRQDGWPGLKAAYELPQHDVRGLEHEAGYRALAAGMVDAVDLYATDAEIDRLGLRALEDDREFFPDYHAILLYRLDLADRAPAALAALRQMESAVSDADMRVMNARVKMDGIAEAAVAADFVRERAAPPPSRDH